jgi:hypothetical protein
LEGTIYNYLKEEILTYLKEIFPNALEEANTKHEKYLTQKSRIRRISLVCVTCFTATFEISYQKLFWR